MDLSKILHSILPLPEHSVVKILNLSKEVKYKKGKILFREGKIEGNIYFLKKGMVRAYALIHDIEVTFWFGWEGFPVVSMKSYVEQKKGYETIELLEDSELYIIKSEELHALYSKDIMINHWGRKFAEKELIKAEERLISIQCYSATERYKKLLGEYPNLIQRVPLGYIASYLGITQVSLSRIRSEIK